jgi:hypothetical protein
MSTKRKQEPNLKEILALLTLLDDPDETIYNEVKHRFVVLGPPVLPHLETAWENSFDVLMQRRIEAIIQSIQEEVILLEGLILVARFQYPDLNEHSILESIHKLKQEVWMELHDEMTALEKVQAINHVLFEVHQFSGNISNYHAPQNSFINHVLESKKGNPILLSALYLHIAQELKVPVYGINLPQHFILAYLNDFANHLEADQGNFQKDILFFINPFSKGLIFQQKDIDQFLKQQELKPQLKHYKPCDYVTMVYKCIEQLIVSYEKLGYAEKVNALVNFQKALKPVT